MPTYEYECSACGETFEHFQSMKDQPLTDCLLCGGKGTVTRLISAGTGLIFKGSGFYATDYKKSGSATVDKTPSKSAGSDSGSGGCCGGACGGKH